jgi:hypothetical protein
MSTVPKSPDANEPLDKETKRILSERNATFEKDLEAAKPWSAVKAALLRNRATIDREVRP